MTHLRAIGLAALAAFLSACSSSSDASTEPPPDGAAPPADGAGAAPDVGAPADAGEDAPVDAGCTGLWVDDAGVTHGCGSGGAGIGDMDDGGGANPQPPTVPMDASDLPFASSCWDNAQCASGICFDYKAKGTFCTIACMNTAQCPLTNDAGTMSVGCNGMGVCRVP